MTEQVKVLVVGTTSDYIQWIRTLCPGRALFLTDPASRHGAPEPEPLPGEELLCDLDNVLLVRERLLDHLQRHALSLDGIACFDCDSMELAAVLGERLVLPFSSPATVRLCRDKYRSKKIWREHGIPAPAVRLVREASEACSFLEEAGGPCVLKPRIGTGSELVFCCVSEQECRTAFRILDNCLPRDRAGGASAASGDMILMETCVEGTEYSCDCLVSAGQVEILRITRKVKDGDAPFGTVLGYLLSSAPIKDIDRGELTATLLHGASSLGISHALCMVDFILRGQQIVLLEMSPRPGGDCLPQLLRRAWRFDILLFALDLAQQHSWSLNDRQRPDCVGLRLHAQVPGILRRINTEKVRQDPRVLEIVLTRQPGALITLPPDDYLSWYLGYILFQPRPGIEVERQCRELRELVEIKIF